MKRYPPRRAVHFGHRIANFVVFAPRECSSIDDDAADRLAGPHQLKTLVDVRKGELVSDQIVDIDLPLHVPIDDLGHISASFGAAKGGALPNPAGHQLKWPGRDLLPGAGDADDDANAPPAVSAFERLPHCPDIADALEAVIGAALGQIHQVGNEIALDLGRVDEMGQSELAGERLALRVDVDPDDHVGADHPAALDDVEPDAAKTKDHDIGPRLDLGGVGHRAESGGDPAADVADLVKRRVLA